MILESIVFLIIWTYLSFNYSAWETDFDIWKMKRDSKKGKSNVTRGKAYKSVAEMMDDINKKDVWYKELGWSVRSEIKGFLDIPSDIYYFFKKGFQRWSRGWADEDVWSIHYFLTKIIPPMLKRLKKTKTGIPNAMFRKSDPTNKHGGFNDKAMKLAEARWDIVMDKMIWTFEMAKKIQEDNYLYQRSEVFSQKEANRYDKIWEDRKIQPSPRSMTKGECIKYEEGWDLFREHFFSLWD